jgi:hypothetical protein
MTPGKEGPGKGKNITVLADFFLSGREYQNCLRIFTGVFGDPLFCGSTWAYLNRIEYLFKAHQSSLRIC